MPTSLLSTDRTQRRRVNSSQDHPAGTGGCSGEEAQARAMGWPSKRPGGDLVAGNLTACVQSVRGNELLYVGDYIGGGHEARLAASSACNDTWRVLRVGQAIAQIMDGHISSIIYIRTYTIHIYL